MLIIGCDYHPGFQQIAFLDTDTGELAERRLAHCDEAERFKMVGTVTRQMNHPDHFPDGPTPLRSRGVVLRETTLGGKTMTDVPAAFNTEKS
jgi:hypothetical protein